MRAKLTAVFDRIVDGATALAEIIIVFIMLLVSINVILRYAFNYQIAWEIEVTQLTLIYITFLLAAWVLRREGHTKMELVFDMLKPRARAMLNFITSSLCIIVCLWLIWYGSQVTLVNFRGGYFLSDYSLRPPYWPLLMIIPIGTFLLLIQFLRRTSGFLASWRKLSTKDSSRIEE